VSGSTLKINIFIVDTCKQVISEYKL